jgi:hypothetical protein
VKETGQALEIPDTLYAASVRRQLDSGKERRIDSDAKATVEAESTSPYARVGPDIVFLGKGGHIGEGPHQPQVDMSAWSTPFSELMDPAVASATSRFSMSAISRVGLYSWAANYSGSDDTQVLSHKVGLKSPTFEGLPRSVQEIMRREYPERI